MRTIVRIVRQQYLGAAALLVVCAFVLGTAGLAVSGQAVLLGRSNIADKPTAVQNTGTGAVLDLQAKAGQPPLRVNSSTLVPKLNADTVDGKHASAFALAGSGYTKAQSDARYARAGSSYTKAQSDAKYAPAGSFYTKAQSDAKYATAGSAYTKAEGDARYGRILLHETWQGTSPDGSETSIFSSQVAAPTAGTLMVVLTQSATPGSTNEDLARFYLAGVHRGGDLNSSTVTDDTRVVTTVVDSSEVVSVEIRALAFSSSVQVDVEGTILVIFYPSIP